MYETAAINQHIKTLTDCGRRINSALKEMGGPVGHGSKQDVVLRRNNLDNLEFAKEQVKATKKKLITLEDFGVEIVLFPADLTRAIKRTNVIIDDILSPRINEVDMMSFLGELQVLNEALINYEAFLKNRIAKTFSGDGSGDGSGTGDGAGYAEGDGTGAGFGSGGFGEGPWGGESKDDGKSNEDFVLKIKDQHERFEYAAGRVQQTIRQIKHCQVMVSDAAFVLDELEDDLKRRSHNNAGLYHSEIVTLKSLKTGLEELAKRTDVLLTGKLDASEATKMGLDLKDVFMQKAVGKLGELAGTTTWLFLAGFVYSILLPYIDHDAAIEVYDFLRNMKQD